MTIPVADRCAGCACWSSPASAPVRIAPCCWPTWAEVLRIEREGGNGWPNPVVDRGRKTLTLDIRSVAGRERSLALAMDADVLIEGFRPG